MKIRSMFTMVIVLLAASIAVAGCGDSTESTPATGTASSATGAAEGATATGTTPSTAATGETAATESTTESSDAGASTIEISADPNGQLKYIPLKVVTNAGEIKLVFTNDSNVPHDVIIGKGFTASGRVAGTRRIVSSSVTKTINLKPGAYSYYCDVPGHRQGGMVGALIVR